VLLRSREQKQGSCLRAGQLRVVDVGEAACVELGASRRLEGGAVLSQVDFKLSFFAIIHKSTECPYMGREKTAARAVNSRFGTSSLTRR
jgi:hypothetical protein